MEQNLHQIRVKEWCKARLTTVEELDSEVTHEHS